VISWFRYVRHAEVAAYERQGWTVVAHLGPVHGAYAVLMRWSGENEPNTPAEIGAQRGAAHLQQRA
jgi:hypothetical protein